LSAPSVTTISPGATPDSTATISPCVGPRLTGRMVTVLSSLTTYTNVPWVPRCTAAEGITVAPRLTSSCMRVFTNWLGNRP
jgi:hypothetical protein